MCVFMFVCVLMYIPRGAMAWSVNCDSGISWPWLFSVMMSVCRGPCALGIHSTHGTPNPVFPGLEVIKLKYNLKLIIQFNYWLLSDTCPQAANHCALFYNLEARSYSLVLFFLNSGF